MIVALMFLSPCLKAEEHFLYQKDDFSVLVPGMNFRAMYLFDFVQSRNLGGAETSVLKYKDFYLDLGLATDIATVSGGDNAVQIPYFGISTPKFFSFLNEIINVGVFLGRDFNKSDTIVGLKASAKLWG